MEGNVNIVQDITPTAAQDGDSAQVVLANMSPRNNVATPAVVGIALSRTKRSSNSSRSSRGQSDSEQKSEKKHLYVDLAKSTDDSDADSENRMVIQSSDSEKEASTAESDKEVKQNGAGRSATVKRKATNSVALDGLSDDEDFRGFTPEEQLMAKKLKSESNESESAQSSPIGKTAKKDLIKAENVQNDQTNKSGTATNVSNTSMQSLNSSALELTPNEKSGHFITRDPRFRNPFKYGWRRELVFRANLDPTAKVDNKGEVYYHSPNGKKLRTKAEIQAHLPTDGSLDILDFTFAKERIGMPAEQEIVRSAKIQTPSQKHRPTNFLDLGTPDPSLGFGKRTPKPKLPKGASPPPTLANNKLRISLSGPKKPADAEIIQLKAPKSAPKTSKNEPCTIQCVLAMGTIPQLQCKKCQCMYHHECVGREKFGGPVSIYICENCILELAEAPSNQSVPQQSSAINSNIQLPAGKLTANKLSNSASKSLIKSNSNRSTNDASRRKSNTNNQISRPTGHVNVQKKDNGGAMNKVPFASLAARSEQPPILSQSTSENNSAAPQSVAVVAGRKYIMVPKKHTTAVLSTGHDVAVNGIPNANDVSQLPHSNVQGGPKILTTGEEATASSRNRKTLRNSTHPESSAMAAALVSAASVHTIFASEFLNNISRGYDILLHTFQYLKVQELLRASRVCRMWNQVANNSILWQTVRMKNSKVNDWSGLTGALKRHGTRHLDLRKILIPPTLNWSDFLENIGDVTDLESIDLCKCPTEVVTGLFERNRNLRVLNAVSINGDSLSIPTTSQLSQLTELRLKAVDQLEIDSLASLQHMKQLRHLSITSAVNFNASKFMAIQSFTSLETLELGECCEFTKEFAHDVLIKLTSLRRLRLEKGQLKCSTFDILDVVAKLPTLAQLELVNFDVGAGFEKRLGNCKHLKRLLLIPTYLSQSATTNNSILAGISKLKDTLQVFTWVVTQELLRVTELYVDRETKSRDRRQQDDKIPILKPVPLMTKDAAILKSVSENAVSEAPQVEILPLHIVQVMVGDALPNLKLNILKVPFHATWRQTMNETS